MCVCVREATMIQTTCSFFHYIANVKFIRGINSAEHNAKLQIDRQHFILCNNFLVSSSVRLTAYKFNCNEKKHDRGRKKRREIKFIHYYK